MNNSTIRSLAILFVLITSLGAYAQPTMSLPTVSGITSTGATLGGTIAGTGITARGTSWKSSAGVAATDNQLAEGGTAASAYTHSRTGMPSGTQIFYVAYGTNGGGTAISSESSFYTLSASPLAQPATFTTTTTSATQINLAFTAANDPAIVAAGYLIYRFQGTSDPAITAVNLPNAAAAPASLPDGSTLITTTSNSATSFSDNTVTANKEYHYAIVPFGYNGSIAATYNYLITGYKITVASTNPPTIGSPTVTGITDVSAILGGTVTSSAFNAITERGTVWKTSAGATIADNKLAEGGTTVSIFSHSRSSLPAATQIFYKAYVTTAISTVLSSEGSFYTLKTPATGQPSSFTAAAASATSIDLTFSDPATVGADGYIILRKQGSTPPDATGIVNAVDPAGNDSNLPGGTTRIVTKLAGTTTYTDGSLTTGTQYSYTIIPFTFSASSTTTYNYLTSGVLLSDSDTPSNGVTITQLSGTVCQSGFSSLGDLIVTESSKGNFAAGTNRTLVLNFSGSGYIFEPNASLSTSFIPSKNVTAVSAVADYSTITITYSVTGTNATDAITISGIKAQTSGSGNPSRTIVRVAGGGSDGVIAGGSVGTTFGSVTSGTPATPTYSNTTGKYCQGTSLSGQTVTVSGTNIKWYNDSNLTSHIAGLDGTNNPTLTVLGISTGASGTSYRYATSTSGCPVTVPFIINALPVADAGADQTVANANTEVCSNISVELGGTPTLQTPTLSLTYNYTWTSAPALSIPNATYSNTSISIPNATASNIIYAFTVSIQDGNNCIGTDTKNVEVKPSSPSAITFTKPTQFNYTVNDIPIDLDATPAGGSFSGTAVYKTGGPSSKFQFDPQQAGAPGSPHSVTYTTTLPNGCTASQSQNFYVSLFTPIYTNLSSFQYCSNDLDVNLQISPSIIDNVEAYVTSYNLSNPTTPIIFRGLVRNYYSAYYGTSTHVANASSTYSHNAKNYDLYQFKTAGAYVSCSTCNYAYLGLYVEYINPNSDPAASPYDFGYSFKDASTAGFMYTGQSVTINPVSFTDFSGLESGLIDPTQFCNLSQSFNLTGTQNLGLFEYRVNFGTYASSGTGFANTGGGTASFNPQLIYGGNSSPITVDVRYTITPGTTGAGGAACKGQVAKQVMINPLPNVNFDPSVKADNFSFCFEDPNSALLTVPNTNVTYSGFGVLDNGNNTGAFSPSQGFVAQNPTSTTDQVITVSATHTDNIGCPRTITRNFRVYPQPTSSYAISPDNDGFYCYLDGQLTLTGSTISGGTSQYTVNYLGISPTPTPFVQNGNSLAFLPSTYYNNAIGLGTSPTADAQFQVDYLVKDAIGCPSTFTRVLTVSPQLNPSIVGVTDSEEYCANEGARKITLTPGNGSFYINNVLQVTQPVNLSNLEEANTFSFENINGGSFAMRYEKVNGISCLNQTSKNVLLLQSPDASFNAPSQCFDTPFTLVSANDTYTASWSWYMDDGTPLLTTNSIDYTYPQIEGVSSRDFNVKLLLAADPAGSFGKVCKDSVTKIIRVGSLPKFNFKFADICENDATSFDVASDLPLQNYQWDFGDGATTPLGATNSTITGIANTTGTFGSPLHTFAGISNYTVKLNAFTSLGCPGSSQRDVAILKKLSASVINPNTPYIMVEQNNGDGFWKVEDVNNSSTWKFAAPQGKVITSTDKFWTTAGEPLFSYKASDISYVNSPCLDLSAYTRPALSVNYWKYTDPGKDGAVLQYSIDGGKSWERLGDLNSGLNWYNEDGISSGPGGQTAYGWSGKDQKEFIVGKHSLSNLVGEPKVRFRIAFASDERDQADGFAFNDVRIEERNRLTLVESFTNVNAAGEGANRAAFQAVPESEVVKIEYYTPAPGSDPTYLLNPSDFNSRAAYYGLTNSNASIPKGFIDGISNGTFNSAWATSYQPLRSLVSAPISIQIENPSSANPDELTAKVTITALTDIPASKQDLQIGIIEKQVGSDKYVLRKLLPSAAGTRLTSPMAKNSAVTITETWSVKNINSVNELAIVAFVQDQTSLDVLQAAQLSTLTNLPTVVTGIGESSDFDAVKIYPNPADRDFTIRIPSALKQSGPITLSDQLGKVVYSSSFSAGEKTKTINTRDLTAGLYILKIESGKETIHQKVVIVHQE